jgi:pteridine reductase
MVGVERLHHKVIAVSGGAIRLGGAIVDAAAAIGMRVAFHYHSSDHQARARVDYWRERGQAVWAWQGDWSREGAPEEFVAATQAHYGQLDVLVNNAGIWRPTPIGTVTRTDWRELMAVNVEGMFAATQAAVPWLTQTQGAVVNICDAGVFRPWSNYTPYLATKGAVASMTLSLARELAPRIRVSAVAPGLSLVPDDWTEQRIVQSTQHIPLKKAGTAQDIAEAVLFLAAAPYITGVILPVDGGVSLR